MNNKKLQQSDWDKVGTFLIETACPLRSKKIVCFSGDIEELSEDALDTFLQNSLSDDDNQESKDQSSDLRKIFTLD